MSLSTPPVRFPFTVDAARCTGCGRCVAACSGHLISLKTSGYRKYAAPVNPEQCSRCLRCVEACPIGAIEPIKP